MYAALAATLLAVLLAPTVVAQAQESEEPVIFDVGDPQGINNISPLSCTLVACYEAWNLQYDTLTDKAADDFKTEPALAKSWEGSADGRTWTYHLRDGLKWSDGEPLTSEDIAWTVNTSREEEWLEYTAVTGNLTATAPDPATVVIKSSVPDPKLPTMDVLILPKHIWGDMSAEERRKYDGEDGVGAGPFVLEEFESGEFARFRSNPNYWGGESEVDEVVLRKYNNADAMVAALQSGELDAAWGIPGVAVEELKADPSLEINVGYQGAFEEIGINGGDGLGDPHPALLDPEVRKAIAHAIDKQVIVDRVLGGYGQIAETIIPSPDPRWVPDLSAEQVYEFDLEEASATLEEAGYEDTDGDGVREMPGGGQPLNFTYLVNSDSPRAPGIAEFVTGWLEQIGIATTKKVVSESQLITLIGEGDYDMFAWSWTPYVDPDQMLSFMKCDQIASDPEDPTNFYNDSNYCDKEYDRLYAQQKVELDPERREEIVHQMLTLWQQAAYYIVLYQRPDIIGYRSDRFTGFQQQPAETGPVLYTNTSPTYRELAPATAAAGVASSDSGGGWVVPVIAIGLIAIVGGAFVIRRRRTADERE